MSSIRLPAILDSRLPPAVSGSQHDAAASHRWRARWSEARRPYGPQRIHDPQIVEVAPPKVAGIETEDQVRAIALFEDMQSHLAAPAKAYFSSLVEPG